MSRLCFLEKYINKLKYEDFREFMNKTLAISALSIFVILLISPISICAQNLNTINHEITLTTRDDGSIGVDESIVLQSTTNESIFNLDFWIQNGANNVVILVNGIEFIYDSDQNRYLINISSLGIELGDQVTIEITYFLNKNTQFFEKKLIQNTSTISVTHDDKLLYSGTNNAAGSQFTVHIFKAATVTTGESSPLIYYIIILILIIFLIILIIFIRRRKTSKINEIANPTEEVLITKKSLLMSLLKDLEKQYRAKEISDDTYIKLKEQYKQETVETMKKLDDMTKSKIK